MASVFSFLDLRLPDRFWSKCFPEPNSGCWMWFGAREHDGYGVLGRGRRGEGNIKAHRLAYETLVGDVPDDLELDHLCRTPECCNPAHLEAVTHAENLRRGSPGRKPLMQCKRGHAMVDMASVFWKNSQWYCRLKGEKVPGKWGNAPTGEAERSDAGKERAGKFAELAQTAIDKRNQARASGGTSLRAWIAVWLPKRAEAGHEWKKDRGRLSKHVLPVLGDLALVDITTAMVADLVHDLRFKKKLANRTARNIYSVLAAALRDAAFAGKIAVSPCILTEIQLGPIADKDPEWRDGAMFTREEAEHLLAEPRIPLDRRIVFAFGLLAGLRPGEIAALRWRHYDAASAMLGRLTIALSYSVPKAKTKGTKTDAVRRIPVHPSLARMLASWRSGWAEMHDREPGPDDLIVPLPPEVKRTKHTGERFRGYNYTNRRWLEQDLPLLGWRHRSVYDTKSTFITLAIDDGAKRDIIRERVTHTKPRRDAFDGYDRGEHWLETCREVAKLRLAPAVHPELVLSSVTSGSEGGFRMADRALSGKPQLRVVDGGGGRIATACDLSIAMLGASSCSWRPDQVQEVEPAEDSVRYNRKGER
jgi:integrase